MLGWNVHACFDCDGGLERLHRRPVVHGAVGIARGQKLIAGWVDGAHIDIMVGLAESRSDDGEPHA